MVTKKRGFSEFITDQQITANQRTETTLNIIPFYQGCPEIEDLFNDLKDGKRLMDLLEIIAGKKIGKPNKGVLR